MQFLEWLETTGYAAWVRESLWGWPIVLTAHAFGTAIVVGVVFIAAMRIFGMFQTIPYDSIRSVLLPTIWFGIAIQVCSGFSLFLTKPPLYATDLLFLLKMAFLVLGIVVTVLFQRALRRQAAAWNTTGKVSSRGVQLSAATAFAWAAVLVMGRLTAYLGQLYDV